jgi:hypothetical protein
MALLALKVRLARKANAGVMAAKGHKDHREILVPQAPAD